MKDLFSRQGFVYCLTHPAMPGLCKIGATRKHPLQRLKELGSSTGVPGRFALSYYRDFEDSFAAETAVHRQLDSVRVDESREFFRLSVEEAVKAIDDAAKTVLSDGVTGGEAQAVLLREAWADVAATPTPWADLFASFTPSNSPMLTEDESRQCRQLAARLRSS